MFTQTASNTLKTTNQNSFSILEEHLNLDALTPLSFKTHNKNHTARPHVYPFTVFIHAMNIVQHPD
jgi:hypothetical protein